jgi:hypothetical protein
MPESEPKPKLIELVGPGAGQGWKAVLKSGKPAVVHEIPVPPAEATAAVPRLQRLFEHRHPALSPVLAWGTDANGVWVATEPNEGTPLSSILTRGPFTPPAAAVLGAAVLSGVAALHEMGIAMGGFGATAVRVNSNGEIRIAGHPAAAVRGAPSQSDLRADVRSCGMAVCAAFGVDPAGAPAPPNIPPGLVVTMRSMASGAMGPSADRAQGALREMAAGMLAPDRQMAAQSELATRAGGREVPAITPFLPAGTVPPGAHAGPSAPAAPAPFIAPPAPRENVPMRGSLYDAPDRPLQTYPSMPAIPFPTAPAAAGPTPAAASAAVQTPPSTPAVPTWSEVPPREAAPAETPVVEEKPAAPAEPVMAPIFESSPPAAAAAAPSEAPPSPAPPPAAPSPPPAQQTWTPVEAPAWKPGGAVPAEPLGTGYAIETPSFEAKPPAPSAPAPAAFTPRPVSPAPQPRPAAAPRPRAAVAPRERPSWLVPAAVAAVIVLLLGAFGVIVLPRLGSSGNPIATVSGKPSGHPTASGRATASPSQGGAPQAVPTYAPSAAAPITKVQFCTSINPCPIGKGIPNETATNCDLSACTVEVAIYFSTGQKVPVAYTLKFFDRCSGETTDLPGPPDFTPPGYAVVIPRDHWAVSIPGGVKSGALVAVASKPTVAASAPLLLGADSC